MSLHPQVPSLLGLSRWFCRDLRKKIYSYMSAYDISIVKLTHMIATIRDMVWILRDTARLEVFRIVAEMHMIDGKCIISQHADAIMRAAIERNDLEFAKYVQKVMFCAIDLSMLAKNMTMEMFDWVLTNATRRGVTPGDVVITPEMLARLRACGYNIDKMSWVGIGLGCSMEDIIACRGSSAIVGVIRSARWDLLAIILEKKPEWAELSTLAEKEIIQCAPACIFDRFIKTMRADGHMRAWKHSPERALRALEMDTSGPIVVKHEAHARMCIAHGRKPVPYRTHNDTWQLDLGMYTRDSWYRFDSMHYPRLHTLIALPAAITSSLNLSQMRWLYEHGVPFSKNFSMTSIVTYEHVKFVLACYKPDLQNVTITNQDPATVQLLYDHGMRASGTTYLDRVYRVDTFRWMLGKFGAYPEIYESIDQLDMVLHEELYAVCKPRSNAMQMTRSIYIAQWLHKKGLVYGGDVDTPFKQFMTKHFGEPYVEC
jgi:hypothetical protein